jgi:hypothetical protein
MSSPKALTSAIDSLSQDKLVEARKVIQKEVDSGKPADAGTEADNSAEFVADLNNVADVLVILVGRYQRASKMLLACLGMLVVCVGFLVADMYKLNHLQREVASLQVRMGDTQQAVREAKVEVQAATDQVKETQVEVKATKEQVQEAAAAAPKIEVDEKGKATVVLPVTKKNGDCKSKDCPEPTKSPNPGSSSAPAPPEPPKAPLDPTLQFR